MIVHTDPQGSPAWLAARRGVITGSRFRDARAKLAKGGPAKESIKYARELARERVGGTVPPVFENAAMKTGTEQEPKARAAYELATGRVVTEAGFITTDDRRFGVSVDGLVGDDGMVEIKTMVSTETLFLAVVERDLSDYVDQCNGAMWLLGRRWCDLVLWAPDLPFAELTVVRIDRDDDVIEALEADMIAFMRRVDECEAALRRAMSLAVAA